MKYTKSSLNSLSNKTTTPLNLLVLFTYIAFAIHCEQHFSDARLTNYLSRSGCKQTYHICRNEDSASCSDHFSANTLQKMLVTSN